MKENPYSSPKSYDYDGGIMPPFLMDCLEMLILVLLCTACFPFFFMTLVPFKYFENRPNLKVRLAWSLAALGPVIWIGSIVFYLHLPL